MSGSEGSYDVKKKIPRGRLRAENFRGVRFFLSAVDLSRGLIEMHFSLTQKKNNDDNSGRVVENSTADSQNRSESG